MTDAIRKAVWGQLIDLASRSNFISSKFSQVGPAVAAGDTLELPEQVSPTAVSSPHTRAAPQSLAPTVNSLSVDQEKFYNINLNRLTRGQLMNGNWLSETSRHAFLHMMNEIDDNIIDAAIAQGAWDAAATPSYHLNLAADAISASDTANAEASLLVNKGTYRQNLIYAGNPYSVGSAKILSSYLPGFAGSEAGRLGIPQVGSINGIPVYETDAAPGGSATSGQFSAAITASAISSNVLTVTCASGHGFVDQQLVYTSGLTTDAGTAASPVTVSSVTATTVVMPLAALDAADNGTGTLYAASSYLLLMDTSKIFVAMQQDISVETVKDFESPDTALQLYSAFGRLARAGSVRVIHSPLSSVS